MRMIWACSVVIACGAAPVTAPATQRTAMTSNASHADPDRDHDGIPNECDVCPDAPETFNGICDEDGCPDVPVDAFPRGVVLIHAVVLFDKQSAKISPLAHSLLEQVVAVMLANPDAIERVAVMGHASRDESQLDATALARATAVKQALVDHNVDASRLETHGVGARRAFDETDTSLNRRVEFVVLRAEGHEQFRLNGDAVDPVVVDDEPRRRNKCEPRPATCHQP